MLLPQIKEREYRFKLALRMGLPIFVLVLILVSHTLITNYETLQPSFYVETTLLLVFSIYFLLFLIYKGFLVQITDTITQTFTREYFFDYLKKEIQKGKKYTFFLVSVENIENIGKNYGIKNGDKVLKKTASFIANYFEEKKIYNFPIGHIKRGDFVVALEGDLKQYEVMIDLFLLKTDEFKVDGIEVKIVGSVCDTSFSKDLNHLIENLFELQNEQIHKNELKLQNPNELELSVVKALKNKKFSFMSQDIFENKKLVAKECFVRLLDEADKPIYPKEYMKILNKLGLSMEYDKAVLEYVLSRCPKDIYVALNISPTSVRNYEFLNFVKQNVQLSKQKLIFVLTETQYYSNIQKYRTNLNSLRQDGVKIAIDRLGSIHTSFLYLRDLDIDIVRFDNFYSKNITKEVNHSIIQGLNVTAHKQNIKTWIKNISNEDGFNISKKLEIDYIQGRFLSDLEEI